MLYKAVGVASENVDHSHNVPIHEIVVGDRVVKLPITYFGLWEALNVYGGGHRDEGRQYFIDSGIGEEIFDEIMNVLVAEGVVVVE